jgi:hypothetical protein
MILRQQAGARAAPSTRQVVARRRARELLRLGRGGGIVVRRQGEPDRDRPDQPKTLTGSGGASL